MNKIGYLDGLRGIAALVVVFHHFVLGFLPALQFGSINHAYSRYDWLLSKTPLNLLYAGNLSVCIFFVLSGYVLSYKFFTTKDINTVIASATKRYIRLLIPVLFSIFVAYVILKLSFFYNKEAGPITFSTIWLSTFYNFEPNFISMLKQAFYGVFFKGDASYNAVLWTMQTEFLGSFLVFGFLALFGSLKNRYVFYLILIALFYNSYFVGFLLGMAIADLKTYNHRTVSNFFSNKIVKTLIITTGLYFGSTPPIMSNFYKPLYSFNYNFHIIGAFFILIFVVYSTQLQFFLSTRFVIYLGKISFSLYIIHLIIICSLSSFLLKVLLVHFSYAYSIIIIFFTSIIVIFALSHLIYKCIDSKGVMIAGNLYNIFFKKDSQRLN